MRPPPSIVRTDPYGLMKAQERVKAQASSYLGNYCMWNAIHEGVDAAVGLFAPGPVGVPLGIDAGTDLVVSFIRIAQIWHGEDEALRGLTFPGRGPFD